MKYLNSLNKINGVGPQKFKLLFNHFESLEAVWRADLTELKASKIPEKLAEKIIFERKNINPEEEWEKLEKENIRMITLTDSDYPDLLKEIPNAPYILYVKGDFDFFNNSPAISIVGSRKYTDYGRQAALSFARDLAAAGITVVSGMALGIDTFAHRGALDSRGKTIAVLGNSLDDESIYPRNNVNLSREIIENGALISDYPIKTTAGTTTFPARNRIIAGLTMGTIVIEAGEKSGSLITANLALEYNREIFSVPGSIFSPYSFGTNQLIKQGARTLTSVADILEELDISREKTYNTKVEKNPSSAEEKILLDILSPDPTHIDNLAKLAKLEVSAVSSTLAMMEIKGWVRNIGGQNYILL
ncbi:MAG: DNA protecting protein DprA [Candidatus Moranbacteria bacterium RIFOXYA12_FULL_44_15]|nr:MAG: DNA protecting protein DprA [Candidatus Moranbacteria bacterium RIFOXYA12_FULL_44_15]OGI34904.1 MAG: DNA protecting protein DprA [Candidatus Moranbacteria bacterium RIFOXYA2_FULL_43_15]